MKKNLCILCVMICAIYACNTNLNEHANEILIDVDNVIDKLNISHLFEDSINIIPLETSSECLISEIQKIVINDDNLYIADRINQIISLVSLNNR